MTTSSAVSLSIGARTDVGAVRERNEDSVLVEPLESPEAQSFGWLGIVADGLGGHRRGDVASALAVQITRDLFYLRRSSAPKTPQALRLAVEHANEAIRRKGEEAEEFADTASTITAAGP